MGVVSKDILVMHGRMDDLFETLRTSDFLRKAEGLGMIDVDIVVNDNNKTALEATFVSDEGMDWFRKNFNEGLGEALAKTGIAEIGEMHERRSFKMNEVRSRLSLK